MKAIIVDIDGTIANTSERLKIAEDRVANEKVNFFDAFLDSKLLHLDTPVPGSKECIRDLAKDATIIYLSGRRVDGTAETEKWLALHGYPKGKVILRRKGIATKPFKIEAIRSLKSQGYDVVCGIGNKEDDIEAYKEASVPGVLVETEAAWLECPCKEKKS